MVSDSMPRKVNGILVVGSIHHDRFSYVSELPMAGETVLAASTRLGLGGKGANQAVASTILGIEVALVAATGGDDSGSQSIAELRRTGVSTAYIIRAPGELTGYTAITVDSAGENTIVVHGGANRLLSPEHVTSAIHNYAASFSSPLIILAQGELPVATLAAVAKSCQAVGARFILNLAPVIQTDRWILELANPLIVNLGEARQLVELISPTVDAGAVSVEALVETLCLSSPSVVITLGGDGALLARPDTIQWERGFAADAIVDTTGAGDAFVGVLAASLSQGQDLVSAVRAGCAAGSIAVTRVGTISSYPSAGELERLLETDPVYG